MHGTHLAEPLTDSLTFCTHAVDILTVRCKFCYRKSYSLKTGK